MVLWNKLAESPRLSVASGSLLATSFLIIARILLSVLLYRIHHDLKDGASASKYIVLTFCLITYPILGEIWEYSGANYMSTGGMLISILTCVYLLTRRTVGVKEILVSGAILARPMSGYEGSVLFYIALVCGLLFYQYCVWGDKSRKGLYWKNAIIYAAPLVIALFLRWGIGSILRLILGVEKGYKGATAITITWGNAPFLDVLRILIIDTVLNYVVNGIVYLPITVFLLAELFLIVYSVCLTIKKKVVWY